MKKFIILSLLVMVLFGCGKKSPDYTTESFEEALNNGEVVDGKTVEVEVFAMEPASAFGYNIQAGNHLNFVSPDNPGVEAGDTIVLKVEKVASMFGSYIITYKK